MSSVSTLRCPLGGCSSSLRPVISGPGATGSATPIGDIGSTNFGRILETADPRIVQFSLRYMF